MAYAQHQSFYLRDKWTSKGLKFLKENPKFFHEKFAFEQIGLGKNMVQSLKFWLLAMNLIEEDKKEKIHNLTKLGELVLKHDRLLLVQDTASILHYQLVKNKEDRATIFDWFFNIYNETIVKRDDLEIAFEEYVQAVEQKEISVKSLKKDIDCLIQLYTKDMNEFDPEDVIYSPFKKLNLLSEHKKVVRKSSPEIKNIGFTALYYVLLNYVHSHEINTLSIDEIISKKFLWGRVFNLSRGEIIEALNHLTVHKKYPIQFVRTNNLDSIKLPVISPIEFLKEEYEEMELAVNEF
ncbi:DUF4007 family protein [Bacillus sp. AFS055030]|uniref:DUF4007 family protein n=1 Tax=Bacillus sp. AFS055030 TaxID=2033507 RepID=UPI000BFD57F6|nr:DUF4007 family protein [Bacillus sp. AFS055030]PGL72613.1 hypothetical protein CN925_04465 [Bacillus sp. AFS055030]